MKLNKEILVEFKEFKLAYHHAKRKEEKQNIMLFCHGYFRGLRASGLITIADVITLLETFVYPEKAEELEELNE